MLNVSNESLIGLVKAIWKGNKAASRAVERKALEKLKTLYSNKQWVQENIKPESEIDLDVMMSFITMNGQIDTNWAKVATTGAAEISKIALADIPILTKEIAASAQRVRMIMMVSGNDITTHLPTLVKEVKSIKRKYTLSEFKLTVGGFNNVAFKGKVPINEFCATPKTTKCTSLNADAIVKLSVAVIASIEQYMLLNNKYRATNIGRYVGTLNTLKADRKFAPYAGVLRIDITTSPLTLRLLEKQIEAFTKLITLSVKDT